MYLDDGLHWLRSWSGRNVEVDALRVKLGLQWALVQAVPGTWKCEMGDFVPPTVPPYLMLDTRGV